MGEYLNRARKDLQTVSQSMPSAYHYTAPVITQKSAVAPNNLLQNIVQGKPMQSNISPSWGSVLGRSFASGINDFWGGLSNALWRLPMQGITSGLDAVLPDSMYNPQNDIGLRAANNFVSGQEQAAQQRIDSLQNMNPAQSFISSGVRAIPNALGSVALGAGVGAGMTGTSNAAQTAGRMLPTVEKGVGLAKMVPFGVGAGGSYARKAENEGANYTQQLLYGIAGGLTEVATELPILEGVGRLINKIKDIPVVEKGAQTLLQRYGKAGKEWLMSIAKETAQEIAIDPITNMAQKSIYSPGMPMYGEGGVIDPAQMWESGRGGTAMSIILTAFGMPATSIAHKRAVTAMKNNDRASNELLGQLVQDIQNESFDQENTKISLKNSGVEAVQNNFEGSIDQTGGKPATSQIQSNEAQVGNIGQNTGTNAVESVEGVNTNVTDIQGRTEPTTEAISKLEQRIIKQSFGSIPEGTKLYEPAADDKEIKISKEIADLFGQKLVHFSVRKELPDEVKQYANEFNGTLFDNTIYINKDRTNVAYAVTGHEITHAIFKDAEIKQQFLGGLKELINEEGKTHINKMIERYKRYGQELTEDQALEEFAGDFVGEQMTKKEFWDELGKRVPGAVQKAIEVIEKIIKKLKSTISAGNQAEKFITDLKMARQLAADALSVYVEKQDQSKSNNKLTAEETDVLQALRSQGITVAKSIREVEEITNQIINEHVEYLKQNSGKGVVQGTVNFDEEGSFANRTPRISNNPQWYSDFYKGYGRAPRIGELKDIAKDQLRNGFTDFTTEIPPHEEFKELEEIKNVYEGIQRKITSGMDKGVYEQGTEGDSADNKVANFQDKTEAGEGEKVNEDKNGYQGKDSTAFKKWFGNSKVVDKNGEPLQVYHGTGLGDFSVFENSALNPDSLYGAGFYFTEDPEIASSYTKSGNSNNLLKGGASSEERTAYFQPGNVINSYGGRKDKVLEYFPGDNSNGWWVKVVGVDNNGKEIERPRKHFTNPSKKEVYEYLGKPQNAKAVYSVYLSIKKPFDVDKHIMSRAEAKELVLEELYDIALENKKDGAGVTLYDIQKVKSDDSEFREAFIDLPYDLQRLGYDGITHIGGNYINPDGKKHRVWIAFSSTQIKSTYNRGTWNENDPDIRNQLKESTKDWSYLKERGFSANVRSDLNMNDNIRNMFDKDPEMYKVLSNKETLAKAQAVFDQGFDLAYAEWNKNMDSFRPSDVPLARLLANDAAENGKYDVARQIIADIAEKLTMAGQFSQAAIILRKADGKTNIISIQRQIDKLNKEGKKLYGDKWTDINLTDDEVKGFNEAKTDEEKEKIKEKIAQRIALELPVNNMEKFDAWRRIAMLLNPTTHVRNILGNVIMAGIETASDTIGAGVETALQKAGYITQEQRTKAIGWKKDKALLKQVEAEWEKSKSDLVNIGKYDIENLRFLNNQKPIFQTKWLETMNELTNNLLNKGDIPFMRIAYVNALGSFVKANGMNKITDEARAYAKRRCLEATFKQPNLLSKFIIDAKRKYKTGGKFIDAAIPFVTTPSNIAIKAFDYSPLGLIRTLFMKGKPPEEVIESLAKGLTGSGIVALGFLLAYLGWGRAGEKKSYKAEELLKEIGDQPYSIMTPLGSYTFDWAQPVAVPLAMGMTFFEKIAASDKVDAETIKDAIAAGGDTIFTMSMLKGIRDFLGGAFGSPAESIMGLPASYVQQAWPTIFGKLARIMDPVRRNPYGETDIEKFKNQWLSKTPIASESLQPKLDIFGREQAQGGAFEQLFSPGYFKEKETDKIMTELYRLYKSTKETDLIPKLAPYKFTDQGKEYKLSPEELTSFQRTMGQANYDDINSLISKDRYKNYTDQEKAIALRKIVKKNYDDAKENYLKEMAEK